MATAGFKGLNEIKYDTHFGKLKTTAYKMRPNARDLPNIP